MPSVQRSLTIHAPLPRHGEAVKLRWLAPLAVLVFAVATLLASGDSAPSAAAESPLEGKIIALDAGHGGDELGATYPPLKGVDAYVYEKDVNLAVVYELEAKLTAAGAIVVLTREADETIFSRRDRVDIAIEKCMDLYGRKCDALVSVHHNGSTDLSRDGLLVIYNERQDFPLAIAVHDALWEGLPHNPNSFVDEDFVHGGYGMTVYDHLVSVLTEAYYITNTWEAEEYCPDLKNDPPDDCRDEVVLGGRANEEADALLVGLEEYFRAAEDDGNNQCPPGNPSHPKCG